MRKSALAQFSHKLKEKSVIKRWFFWPCESMLETLIDLTYQKDPTTPEKKTPQKTKKQNTAKKQTKKNQSNKQKTQQTLDHL